MRCVNIEDAFIDELMFSTPDGYSTPEERRERLEWEIEEYYAAHEQDSEPVISPFSMYMVGFIRRQREIAQLSPEDMRKAVREAWDIRDRRFRNNKTKKGTKV